MGSIKRKKKKEKKKYWCLDPNPILRDFDLIAVGCHLGIGVQIGRASCRERVCLYV